MRRTRRHLTVTGTTMGALALLLATGCSSGEATVPRDEVAKQASAVLAEQVGQEPDDFTCAEDLPAKVGASIRCELTSGGQKIGVTVTTTSVEGSTANFDVQVDDEPMS